MFKKLMCTALVVASPVTLATELPGFDYVQASYQHWAASGEDAMNLNGFQLSASWQFSDTFYLATSVGQVSDRESYTESYSDGTVSGNVKLALTPLYIGAGYILPLSDRSTVDFGLYYGSYGIDVKYHAVESVNGQHTDTYSAKDSTTKSAVKTEARFRSQFTSALELNAKASWEYLNWSDLDSKSQFSVGAGLVYAFNNQFGLSADIERGKLFDTTRTSYTLGLRYNF